MAEAEKSGRVNDPSSSSAREINANPGYALGQLARSLLTIERSTEDEAHQRRAQSRVDAWERTFSRMLSGDVTVGSREAVKDTPVWATLEVLHGGFASGELLAGGPLQDHERDLLRDRLGEEDVNEDDTDAIRRSLNAFFLSEAGMVVLHEMLESGCYEVTVPEEGALLVVAWLLRNEHGELARTLLQELAPFFPRLRFYPVPLPNPRSFGSRVYLQDVRTAIQSLREVRVNLRINAEKEAIRVWVPLYDRVVGLFLETVKGDIPTVTLAHSEESEQVQEQAQLQVVEGGWPCQVYPEDWRVRVQELLAEYAQQRAEHQLCRNPEKRNRSFQQLRTFLQRCAEAPESLKGIEVGRIRLLLAGYVSKRGVPKSERCQEYRRRQSAQLQGPSNADLASVLISRLRAFPGDRGLDDVSVGKVLKPVSKEEEEESPLLVSGTTFPEPLQRKVIRSLCDTTDVLVERGIITSGESLARVLPQITSGLRAAAIVDQELRQLYAGIYRAFRRRRSLLLLNLQSQVRIAELPWVAAIDRFRKENLSARDLSRQALEEVVRLTLTWFPHAIVPNKLLQELRALARESAIAIPLVDEIAADIFMGQFSPKFLRAAKEVAEVIDGTLYARYYGIDSAEIRQLETPAALFQLCLARAGCPFDWRTAHNGMILEQEMILTTHNLALLFDKLGLMTSSSMQSQLPGLARKCFEFVCRRQQVEADVWHARLIMVKNTAYAWRQMLFFLSAMEQQQPEKLKEFMGWAVGFFAEQSEKYRACFAPAMAGLQMAVDGASLVQSEEVRRFQGWSGERHWLLNAMSPAPVHPAPAAATADSDGDEESSDDSIGVWFC